MSGAASPELLASLREFVAMYDESTRQLCSQSIVERFKRAEAVIAKAEGVEVAR